MSPKQPDNTEKTQISRFVEIARALGCDEDPAAFDEKLAAVVRATKLGVSHPHADEDQPEAKQGDAQGHKRQRKVKQPV